MKTCTKCGIAIHEKAKICGYCNNNQDIPMWLEGKNYRTQMAKQVSKRDFLMPAIIIFMIFWLIFFVLDVFF
jgi:uncharacterized membrane protein YvbJ